MTVPILTKVEAFRAIKRWAYFYKLYKKTHLHMKAIWNNTIIAESDDTILIENNHYFPPASVNKEFLRNSETHTVCSWKGEASYYTIEVDGKNNTDAAWYYPETKYAAENIKGYIAFWRGVKIEK